MTDFKTIQDIEAEWVRLGGKVLQALKHANLTSADYCGIMFTIIGSIAHDFAEQHKLPDPPLPKGAIFFQAGKNLVGLGRPELAIVMSGAMTALAEEKLRVAKQDALKGNGGGGFRPAAPDAGSQGTPDSENV